MFTQVSAMKMLFNALSAPHPSAFIHHLGMSAVTKQTPASFIKAFPDNIVSHWLHTRSNFCFYEIKYCKFQVTNHIFITSPITWSQERQHNPKMTRRKTEQTENTVFFCSSGPSQILKNSTAPFPGYTRCSHFTYCVTAGAQTGCDPWPWCCSSNGGCGTGAGTLRSSPISRTRWPASPWDAGGTAGAACSSDRGCCRTSPGSPGYPCTCRGDRGNSHGNQEYI